MSVEQRPVPAAGSPLVIGRIERFEAAVGLPVEALETPVLVLDLDRFEHNARTIMAYLREHGVDWRPHSKGHKSPGIARRQVALGAIGVTVAKTAEAEVMIAGGVPSVLLVTEPAVPSKMARIAALQRSGEAIIPVDSVRGIEVASAAALEAGVTIPVVVEVDIGMHRCGVGPGEPTVELARRVRATPGLALMGIFGYEGHLLTAWPAEDKEAQIRETVGLLASTRALMEAEGLPCSIVSTGGTGSYRVTATVPGITELQAGGGSLMDWFYREKCHVEDLEFALTVRTTVVSRPAPSRAVTDGGWKTMSIAHGKPRPVDLPGVEVASLSAEHGVLEIAEGGGPVEIGDVVTLVPGYHDSTVVLHDVIYGVRNGVVEEAFPLLGRGALA